MSATFHLMDARRSTRCRIAINVRCFQRVLQASSCARMRDASRVIDDGEYEVVVTDVARDDDGMVVIELAIAIGALKGDVV
ncbi:MAG: hypothetical protein Q8K63_00785, partial [Acidimicrobiales bacterium]|nr:hypothetical protein [Acidimicrobiales bacterium]